MIMMDAPDASFILEGGQETITNEHTWTPRRVEPVAIVALM